METFSLLTNHHLLTTILSPNQAVPSMAAARMQRWALVLAACDYTIQFREAARHGNADGLSWLPLPVSAKEKPDTVELFHINYLGVLPVSCKEIRTNTRTDPVLVQVLEIVSTGRFPKANDVDSALAPFLSRKDELTIQQHCLM